MKGDKTKVIMICAVVLVVLGVGAAAYALITSARDAGSADVADTPKVQQGPANEEYVAPDPLLPTIVFTDKGFSQSSYTFPVDTDIRVDNQSSTDLQFSSDDHPTHTQHTELNMKVLAPGKSGTFTPAGKGTYGFHDHLNDQYEGTLIIK